MHSFFVMRKVENSLPEVIIGKFSEGSDVEKLLQLDYLECFGPIPIFSEKFVHGVREMTSGLIDFYPMHIQCNRQNHKFYFGYIKNRIRMVDGLASRGVIGIPYFKADVIEDFIIAYDASSKFSRILAVSENFVKISRAKKLKISFREVNYSS